MMFDRAPGYGVDDWTGSGGEQGRDKEVDKEDIEVDKEDIEVDNEDIEVDNEGKTGQGGGW